MYISRNHLKFRVTLLSLSEIASLYIIGQLEETATKQYQNVGLSQSDPENVSGKRIFCLYSRLIYCKSFDNWTPLPKFIL